MCIGTHSAAAIGRASPKGAFPISLFTLQISKSGPTKVSKRKKNDKITTPTPTSILTMIPMTVIPPVSLLPSYPWNPRHPWFNARFLRLLRLLAANQHKLALHKLASMNHLQLKTAPRLSNAGRVQSCQIKPNRVIFLFPSPLSFNEVKILISPPFQSRSIKLNQAESRCKK